MVGRGKKGRGKKKKEAARKKAPADFSNRPFAGLGSPPKKKASKKTARNPPECEKPAAEPVSEEVLFIEAMSGVSPLDRPAPPPPAPPKADLGETFTPLGEDEEALARLAEFVAGDGPFDVRHSDEYVEGAVRDLDGRILEHLRRGLFPLQGHLDLHGLSRAEAKEAVERYLAHCRAQRRRCVLLITGRGLSSPEGRPILKTMVAGLLTTRRMSRQVLAFATARPEDGGAGAIYVLLRR